MPFTADQIKWFRRKIKTWAKTHLRDFPWRNTKDPYSILVAEFLLQKTDVNTALPLYQELMEKYPTIEILSEAPLSELAEFFQPLGLHFRATRLHKSALAIVEDYGGKVPNNEAQLLALPGVGKYTARALLANAFNRPLAVLDTNIARIFERFFGLRGGRVKSRDPLLWNSAQEAAPKTKVAVWNLTLIDFGAAVCTARNPRCYQCPLSDKCEYRAEASDRISS